MSLVTAETNNKITSIVDFIPRKFWTLPQEVLNVVLHTGLNVHRETSGGSLFVTNSLLVCYKWSKTRPSSYTSLFFLVPFTKACPTPIQNNMHSWWIEIKEILKYKRYDNIGDLSKTTFDIIAMTPRGALGLCYVHIAQLMTHSAIHTLPFTLQLCYMPLGILQRVTKSQKVHISSHDELQKLHNINFAWHSSGDFLRERVEKQEFPPSPYFLEFESRYTILNEGQGWSWTSHSETNCGNPCCNKTFKFC